MPLPDGWEVPQYGAYQAATMTTVDSFRCPEGGRFSPLRHGQLPHGDQRPGHPQEMAQDDIARAAEEAFGERRPGRLAVRRHHLPQGGRPAPGRRRGPHRIPGALAGRDRQGPGRLRPVAGLPLADRRRRPPSSCASPSPPARACRSCRSWTRSPGASARSAAPRAAASAAASPRTGGLNPAGRGARAAGRGPGSAARAPRGGAGRGARRRPEAGGRGAGRGAG